MNETVIAKFRCVSVEPNSSCEPDGMQNVALEAVTSDDPEDRENYAFGQATPAGSVRMMMTAKAADHFKPGDDVYATFSADRG